MENLIIEYLKIFIPQITLFVLQEGIIEKALSDGEINSLSKPFTQEEVLEP